jgi:hypothetical protein
MSWSLNNMGVITEKHACCKEIPDYTLQFTNKGQPMKIDNKGKILDWDKNWLIYQRLIQESAFSLLVLC